MPGFLPASCCFRQKGSLRGPAQSPAAATMLTSAGLTSLPFAGLQAAIGIDPELPVVKAFPGERQEVRHLLDVRHARRVDVVDSRADLVRILELLKASSSSIFERDVSMEMTSASIAAIAEMMSLNSE